MKREFPYTVPATIIAPATLTDDNTPTAMDLLGYDAALILIRVGVGGITFSSTNKVEFKITHSDDNSTYAAVGSGDVVLGSNCDAAVTTGGIVYSLVAAHAAETISDISYVGGKRYIKLLADFGGTHGSGTLIDATLLKGYAHYQA